MVQVNCSFTPIVYNFISSVIAPIKKLTPMRKPCPFYLLWFHLGIPSIRFRWPRTVNQYVYIESMSKLIVQEELVNKLVVNCFFFQYINIIIFLKFAYRSKVERGERKGRSWSGWHQPMTTRVMAWPTLKIGGSGLWVNCSGIGLSNMKSQKKLSCNLGFIWQGSEKSKVDPEIKKMLLNVFKEFFKSILSS